MLETIKERTLRELVEANSVRSACLVGQHGGFAVTVRYGIVEKTLSNARGETRVFASLNTATEFLRRMGIVKFEVDATDYEPGRLRKPRPDRAQALKNTRTRPTQGKLI